MEKATILVVDDTPENIDILVGVLGEDYKVRVAIDGSKAIQLAAKTQPDLILLDVMMPGMSGYEVCQHIKQDPLTAHIPVIFVTAMSEDRDETRGFQLGAVDYITKPVSAAIVKARVKTHLSLHNQKRLLEEEVQERTQELDATRIEIIRRLSRAAEYKDNETGQHIVRMSHYSRILARQAGLPEHYCELIYNAAPMHDVGKIGIPDVILNKPGKLAPEEWDIMKQHVVIGAEILGEHHSDPLLRMSYNIALTHHEKWDGSGYPNAIAGEDIPLEGRITAIADVFDALTSTRPYKKAWTIDAAMDLIDSEAGKHFDPDLVEHFKSALGHVIDVHSSYNDGA